MVVIVAAGRPSVNFYEMSLPDSSHPGIVNENPTIYLDLHSFLSDFFQKDKMASHKSVTTTVIRNEIDQVATDSKFMLSMTDQDGDGLLSMEEAREKVNLFIFF